MDANENQLRIESRTETTDGRRGSSQPISTVLMADCDDDDAEACDGTVMESGQIPISKSDGNGLISQEDGTMENG